MLFYWFRDLIKQVFSLAEFFFLRIRLCTTVAQSWAPISDKIGASLVAQLVKNLPAMQETRVQALGQEYPLEKKTATHSSILA